MYPGQLEILDIYLTSVVSLPYFNPAVLQMEVNALILENADNLYMYIYIYIYIDYYSIYVLTIKKCNYIVL